MGRKVFISFLGASNYKTCDYTKDNVSYGGPVRFIQESTLKYLISIDNWKKDDAAYFLLTEKSEAQNWNDDGQTDREGKPIEGLKSRLEKMNLPFHIIPVTKLPEGNTEEEIWVIFNRIFEIINEGDELYFDITHGYRYLPMLMLVLGSYSKFLKRTSIKSVTYGNYEVSDGGKQPGLIMDLLPLNALQDWTYAAGQYLDSGNINQLKVLSERVLKPILRDEKIRESGKILKGFIQNLTEVVDDWGFCRGININNSDHTPLCILTDGHSTILTKVSRFKKCGKVGVGSIFHIRKSGNTIFSVERAECAPWQILPSAIFTVTNVNPVKCLFHLHGLPGDANVLFRDTPLRPSLGDRISANYYFSDKDGTKKMMIAHVTPAN